MDRGQRARTGGDRERGDAEDAARDAAHGDSERFRFAVLRVDAEWNLAYADMDRSGDAGGVLVDGHRLDEFPTQCSDDHVRRLHAGAERGQGAIARYGRCDHGGGTVHMLLLRVVAHIRAGKFTLVGAALGALAVAVMQLLGARLLTGASRNPMLAPFAAIIGVLIWFNLVAQVIMICAAFIAECRRGGAGRAGASYSRCQLTG